MATQERSPMLYEGRPLLKKQKFTWDPKTREKLPGEGGRESRDAGGGSAYADALCWEGRETAFGDHKGSQSRWRIRREVECSGG